MWQWSTEHFPARLRHLGKNGWYVHKKVHRTWLLWGSVPLGLCWPLSLLQSVCVTQSTYCYLHVIITYHSLSSKCPSRVSAHPPAFCYPTETWGARSSASLPSSVSAMCCSKRPCPCSKPSWKSQRVANSQSWLC